MLNEKEKKEWLALSKSIGFQQDMRRLKGNQRNRFSKRGKMDIDKLIELLTHTNAFFNHRRKRFKPMVDREMKL